MSDKPSVLIVDDEENLCLLYGEELAAEGYRVQVASDVAAALRMVEESPPDVVVLDIRMPRMDGIEAMGRMLAKRHDLPVILNSAYSSYKDDFRTWPATDYVIKSSDLSELKAAIGKALAGCGKAPARRAARTDQ